MLLIGMMLSVAGMSQPMGGARAGGMGSQTGRFYGKIVDEKSGKGIDAASVQLISSKFDRVTRQKKDTIITGMLTQPNGDFSLENVPMMGDYKLAISAMGYAMREEKVSFITPEQQKQLMEAFAAMAAAPRDSTKPAPNPMDAVKKVFGGDMSKMMAMADKDLGNFKLTVNAKELEGVTVTGKSMILAVDRKVFNVDKNLSASGSTATDLMKQIPSVNVDIDGNVKVRNSTPTLFVDGRPTTLTLDQIPSDEIQSVELITNPSAKYDASGGAAAILNIVMKKNRKPGYNGSLRAGIDSRAKPNFGGDLSVKQGKVNAFVSGMYGARKSISESDITTAYVKSGNSPGTLITQDINSISEGYFGNVRAGVDYFMDNRNTLTISGNYVKGKFGNDEDNWMRYDSLYNPIKTETGYRHTISDRNFQNLGGTLSFKHLFAKPGHELTADVNFSANKFNGLSEYNNQMYNVDQSVKGNPELQNTVSTGSSKYFVGQADYANPITENIKIEAGVRAQVRSFTSVNDNYLYDYNVNDFVKVANISANYEFTDRVYAAYTTITGKAGKFGYNLGLRAESSNYDGKMLSNDSSFNVNFPFSFFPSAFVSYKVNDKSDVQLNYTRRINRPNFFQLMPFVDYTDPLNLSVGNPGLKPEFTNSIEANYAVQFNNLHTLLVSAYYKNTNDLITRYQYKGINEATKDSAIYNTYINANNSNSYGIELTSTNKLTKKFDMTTNVNFYNATINSDNISKTLADNSQLSFFGKMTLTQRLGKNNQWTLQANGDYQSKTVLPVNSGGGMRGPFGGNQAAGSNGYVNPNYGVDMSVKREFLKAKGGTGYMASLTLSVNDVFKTRIYDAHTSSSFFVQDLTRRRDWQVFRLQFNWRFGKRDMTLFKRKNMKGEMEGMSEGMSGAQ